MKQLTFGMPAHELLTEQINFLFDQLPSSSDLSEALINFDQLVRALEQLGINYDRAVVEQSLLLSMDSGEAAIIFKSMHESILSSIQPNGQESTTKDAP